MERLDENFDPPTRGGREAARSFMTEPLDGTELLLGTTVPLGIAAIGFGLALRIWQGMNRAD